eukprot:7382119-Prymnesium_polylepis.1
MNEGECHTGERHRWQRARARIGCLSPGYILYGNPSHRGVCPCTVSDLLAPAMSRTYVIRAVHPVVKFLVCQFVMTGAKSVGSAQASRHLR